jgi:hypothetical protein
LADKKPSLKTKKAFPGTKTIVAFGVAMALVSFVVRIVAPVNYWVPLGLFEPFHLTEYVMLFGAGIIAYREGWTNAIPAAAGKLWSRIAILMVFLLVVIGAAIDSSQFDGGLTVASLLGPFWEAFMCVSMCIALLALFKNKYNSNGPLAKAMASNAFTVYLYHLWRYISAHASGRGLSSLSPCFFCERKRNVLFKNLSGGLKQRVGIAIALVNDPEIVFLDEPTTGLDPRARRDVWEAIKAPKSRGKTVFLTTHYMDEAYYLADRIDVIHKGKIIVKGAPEDLINQYGGGNTLVIRGCDKAACVLLAGEIADAKIAGDDIVAKLPANDGMGSITKAVALINDRHIACQGTVREEIDA